MTREHRIAVTDDGHWKAMKTDDGVEECLGHRGGCVGVTQWNEMSILRKAIDHCQNDTLAVDTG
jgi:hypothetical protein